MLDPLHLAAHSAIVDYESGRRIPSVEILTAYEHYFGLPAGYLQRLRNRALSERTAREARQSFDGLAADASNEGIGRNSPWSAPKPAQLPHDVVDFTARAGEIRRLHDLLVAAPSSPNTMIIAALDGIAGVGKTALAVHFAHQVRDRFVDGQMFLNLRGFGPSGDPMLSTEALDRLLRALGVDSQKIPETIDERAALLRSVLYNKKMLLLLDNAVSAEQPR